MAFWGRTHELGQLRDELDRVQRTGTGRLLAIRGRRQAGKSRLITEFVARSSVPSVFTTAVKGATPAVHLGRLVRDLHLAEHAVPQAARAFAAAPTSWADAFTRLSLLPLDEPTIVVIDEFPWAVEADPTLEGALQVAWDRELEQRPILLVLVGSDVTMMERLTMHDRPLFGRAREMVVAPLDPSEVQEALGPERSAVDVLDLHLVTGGFPRLVLEAAEHPTAAAYVAAQLTDEQSPLCTTGQRTVDAEFPAPTSARTVLEAIGSTIVGPSTFSAAVARLGGGTAAGTAVTRALDILVDAKQVVAIDRPVGAGPGSRSRRYRIADPGLRFWFRFCAPHLPDIARGRADLAINAFRRDFSTWRGLAIEPTVHDAIWRLAGRDDRFADIVEVGSWWNRNGNHEFDVVGADRAADIDWVGTVKWRPNRPVTAAEVRAAGDARGVIPHAANARIVAVCPAGARPDAGADAVLDAADVVSAFAAD